MNNKKDTLFQTDPKNIDSDNLGRNTPGRFVFDERVANVFDDMISRSVPGYQQILEMLPTITRQFKSPNAQYYDLGCSLGAGLLAISEGLDDQHANLIGVDNSAAMVDQAKLNLKGLNAKLLQEDLLKTPISNAAMVLMNFTLQFIAVEQRPLVIENIYNGLNSGGVFILSEKIKFDNEKTNQTLIDIHHQYKADQGYSQLEIARKRDAIENVLIPETLETHINRLTQAGFDIVSPWVQNLQFISILAIK